MTPATSFGNKAVTQLDDGDGSLQPVSGFSNNVQFEQSVDTDPDLAYGERSDGHTIGLIEGGTLQRNGSYSSGIFRHIMGIWQATASQTFELNQAGTATGRRKATTETFVTSVELASEIGGTTTFNTEHKVAADVVWSDN